jgi:hypothetical protein
LRLAQKITAPKVAIELERASEADMEMAEEIGK